MAVNQGNHHRTHPALSLSDLIHIGDSSCLYPDYIETLISMWLEGIPIPPSLNNAYPAGKNGRRFKSKELVAWERDFDAWAMINYLRVREVRKEFADIPKGVFVAVNCVYYFRKDRVLCKDGRAKRLDADNRLKCLLDKVTQLLGFDDALIWQGGFYKRVAASGSEFCKVDVRLLYPEGSDAVKAV